MKATLKWLKEYIDFDLSPEELAEAFTMAGIEVENISHFAKGIGDIISGKVISLKKLEGEEKLFFCEVNIGTEILKIVTGAPNIREGMIVAVAPKGTLLPTGIRIKTETFRGVDSNGILCSEQDLGLVDYSEEIIELAKDSAIGKAIPELVETEDIIFELSPTPNRPDCLSIYGLAREISAFTGNPLKLPKLRVKESEQDISKLITIEILEPELCPRYTARVIQDVKVSASPSAIRRRLKSVGIRSINNIVDITNYVLMEFGHPLHAFDYDLIADKKILVRRAKNGEKFKTLDGVERILWEENLLIADMEKGIALAGIMGGENTQVSDSTRNILLESAYFNPVNIRRSSKYLGLSTEASYRFERGADPEILMFVLDRTASLTQEICGGRIAAGILDEYPKKIPKKTILFHNQKIEKILGIKIPPKKASDIMEKLGMTLQEEPEGVTRVTVPSYRPDLTREIDLIEEIARIFGYANIPTTSPPLNLYYTEKFETTSIIDQIKDIMTGWGFFEVINYSFIDEKSLSKLLIKNQSPFYNFVRLKKPLSEEQNILRTTLIPGLLGNLELNIKRFIPGLKIFEIGKVFFQRAPNELPEEKTYFSALLSGEYESKSWIGLKRKADFFDAKGIVESLSKFLSIPVTFQKNQKVDEFLDPGKSAKIYIHDKYLGFLGELNPEVIENFGIQQEVVIFELSLDEFISKMREEITYKPIPKNPPAYRDISIIIPELTTFQEVINIIRKVGGKILEEVRIFDLYKGKQIPHGKKSMTFSLVFRDPQRTLTDEEVDKIRLKIISELNKKLGAELRS